MQTKLGKLKYVRMGFGGYDYCMFGLQLTLDMKGTCVEDFICASWIGTHEGTDKAIRSSTQAQFVERMIDLMKDANIKDINELNGIPVEVTLDDNKLKSWRILTEVL